MTLEEARSLVVNGQQLGAFDLRSLKNALVWAQTKLRDNPASSGLQRVADACRVLIADAEKDQVTLDLGPPSAEARSSGSASATSLGRTPSPKPAATSKTTRPKPAPGAVSLGDDSRF